MPLRTVERDALEQIVYHLGHVAESRAVEAWLRREGFAREANLFGFYRNLEFRRVDFLANELGFPKYLPARELERLARERLERREAA
jgi:hypothetical protein